MWFLGQPNENPIDNKESKPVEAGRLWWEKNDGTKEKEKFKLIEDKLLNSPYLRNNGELKKLAQKFKIDSQQLWNGFDSLYVSYLQETLKKMEQEIDNTVLKVMQWTIQIVPQTPAVQTVPQPVQQAPVVQEPKNPPLSERIRMKGKGVVPAALSWNSTKADTSKQSVPENSTTVVRKLEIFKAYIEIQPINETKKSIILSHITNLSTFLSWAPYLVDHKEFKDSFSKIEDVIKAYIENGKRVSSFDAFDDSLLKEYEKNIQKVIWEAKQWLSTIITWAEKVDTKFFPVTSNGLWEKLSSLDSIQDVESIRRYWLGIKLSMGGLPWLLWGGTYKVDSPSEVNNIVQKILEEMWYDDISISNLSPEDRKVLFWVLDAAVRVQNDFFTTLQSELKNNNNPIILFWKEIRFKDDAHKVKEITKVLTFFQYVSRSPKEISELLIFFSLKVVGKVPLVWSYLFWWEWFLIDDPAGWIVLFFVAEFIPTQLSKLWIPYNWAGKLILDKLEKSKIERAKAEVEANKEWDFAKKVEERKKEIETLIELEKIKTWWKLIIPFTKIAVTDNWVVSRLSKLIEDWRIYLPEELYRRYFYWAYEANFYWRKSSFNTILTWANQNRWNEEYRKELVEKEKYIVQEITNIKKSIYWFPWFEYGTTAEKSAILKIDAATKKFFQEGKDKAIDTNWLDGEQIKEKIAKELRNFVMQEVDLLLPEWELKDYLSKELLDKSNPEDVKKIEEDAKTAKQVVDNRVYDPSVSETEKALDKAARKRYIGTLVDDLIQWNHSSTRIEYRMRLLIVLWSNPNNYKQQFSFESLSQEQLLDTLEKENLEFDKNVVKKFKDDTKINALKERQDKLKDRISELKPYYSELDGIDMSKVEEKNLKALEETVEKLEGLRWSYDWLVNFKSDIDSLIKGIVSDVKGKLLSWGTLTLDARLWELISEIPQIGQIVRDSVHFSAEGKNNIARFIQSWLWKIDHAWIITSINRYSSVYGRVTGDKEVRNLLEKAFSWSDIDFDTIAKIEQYYKEYDGKQLQPAERNKNGVIIKEEVSVEEQRAKLRDELLWKTETSFSTEIQTPKENTLSHEEGRKIDIATGFIEEVYRMYSNNLYQNFLDISIENWVLEAQIAAKKGGGKGVVTIKIDTLSNESQVNAEKLIGILWKISTWDLNWVNGPNFSNLKALWGIVEYTTPTDWDAIEMEIQARKSVTPEEKKVDIEEIRKSAERKILELRGTVSRPK